MDRRSYIKANGIWIGGMFFSASIITFMESCKRNGQENPSEHLSKDQWSTVNGIADLILPPTNSPGAGELNLADKIEAAIFNSYEEEDQFSFVAGINHINHHCQLTFNSSFGELDEAQKHKVMDWLIADSQKPLKSYEKHVYSLLKGLAIIGYFTDETINKLYLLYDPIPGQFVGDIPYSEVGGLWSTHLLDS